MAAGSASARRLEAVGATVERISINDLTMDQLEAVEKAVGYSSVRWGEVPSQGELFKHVYSVYHGVTLQEAGALTVGQLMARVDLSGADPDSSEPTPQSA